jgi:hypothetical protein
VAAEASSCCVHKQAGRGYLSGVDLVLAADGATSDIRTLEQSIDADFTAHEIAIVKRWLVKSALLAERPDIDEARVTSTGHQSCCHLATHLRGEDVPSRSGGLVAVGVAGSHRAVRSAAPPGRRAARCAPPLGRSRKRLLGGLLGRS